jgi:hypothetical protein
LLPPAGSVGRRAESPEPARVVNLFFVETPLQVINAIEAKHTLALDDNHLMVLLTDIYPLDLFRPLLAGEQWDSIRYVDAQARSRSPVAQRVERHLSPRLRNYQGTLRLRQLRQMLDALARAYGHARRLLIGNYSVDHMRHLANVLRYDELLLLDDGTGTLGIAQIRAGCAPGGDPTDRLPLRKRLVRRLIGWRLAHPDRATFFTMYDVQGGADDTIVRHSYEHFRTQASSRERTEDVFFLGMTLYFEGITEDAYFDQLRRVGHHYAGRSLIYVPHKGEPRERIERVRAELGWVVRRFDVPIEFQLAMRGPLPGILASFFSSALENCRLIFGDELQIEAVYLDPALLPKEPEFVRTIYDYYGSKTSQHFRVVKL